MSETLMLLCFIGLGFLGGWIGGPATLDLPYGPIRRHLELCRLSTEGVNGPYGGIHRVGTRRNPRFWAKKAGLGPP